MEIVYNFGEMTAYKQAKYCAFARELNKHILLRRHMESAYRSCAILAQCFPICSLLQRGSQFTHFLFNNDHTSLVKI